MSLSALLYGQCWPVRSWTANTVDAILSHGDSMHLYTLTNGTVPDMATLRVGDLPVGTKSRNETEWAMSCSHFYQMGLACRSFAAEPPYFTLVAFVIFKLWGEVRNDF